MARSVKEARRLAALEWRRDKQAEADRLRSIAKAKRADCDAKRAEADALGEEVAAADIAARTAQAQVSEWHPENSGAFR